MGWWVSELWHHGEIVALVSQIFWVLAAITLHELSHGWAALWQGDDTPRRSGHMTVNPLVHMGAQALIAFALVGLAWGRMPVNPYRFRNRRFGHVLVAAAGPAMNLLLAAVCLAGLAVWLRVGPAGSPVSTNVRTFLLVGLSLNLVLAALNVVPIPPLDGSTILAGFSPSYRRLIDQPNAPIIGLFIFLAVFFMSPVGDLILMEPVAKLTGKLVVLVMPSN